VEEQTTRVLTVRRSPGPEGGEPPHAGRPPGREPDAVYRRRRLIAAAVGGILFFLVIVLIVSAGGSDPEPKSTPADLGVGGAPSVTTPSSDRDKKTKTTQDEDTAATPAVPTTPPATGGTPSTGGGTTVTPVAPTQPQDTGGGAGQPAQPAPAPTDEGGGAAAPPGNYGRERRHRERAPAVRQARVPQLGSHCQTFPAAPTAALGFTYVCSLVYFYRS
jgi:hypothetical protein